MASKPTPDASKPKANASSVKPDGSKPKPDAPEPKPDAPKPKRGVSKPKRVVSKPKPGASKSKPGASSTRKPKPGQTKAQSKRKPKATGAPTTGVTNGEKEKPAERRTGGVPPPTPQGNKTANPTVPTPSAAVPSTVNQQEKKLTETKETKLTRNDTLVIAALWSLEIVNSLTESWKTSFLLEDFKRKEEASKRINFLVSIQATRMGLLVLTLIAVAAVAYLADGKKKFEYLFAGLCVYFITPVIGLLATNLNAVGLIDLILLLQFGWTSVSALRYWFILHQKIPLSVIQTRSIVTYNELFVDLTDYITIVWVSLTAFDTLVYNVAWTIILVLMFVWLGMVWAVKSYINNTEDKIEVERKVYEEFGLLGSFNVRQTFQHLVLFLCLIFPSMMMSMQKGTVSYIFRQLRKDLPLFAQYRIDLVIALWCLPIVTGMLIKWFAVRQEMRDLFVIGIAHFLNIVVCVCLILLIVRNISGTPKDFRVGNEDSGALVTIPHDSVITFIMYPEPEHENLIIISKTEHKNKVIDYQGYDLDRMSAIFSPKGSTIWVTGKFPNGTVVSDTKLIANSNEGYYLKNKNLTKIKGFGRFFKPMPTPEPTIILLLISELTPCETGPQYDNDGTRCIFNGGCHSVRITFIIKRTDMQPNDVSPWVSNVPHLGGVISNLNITFPDNGSISFLIAYSVDGVMLPVPLGRVSLTKDVHSHSPYVIISTRVHTDNGSQSFKSRPNILPRYAVEEPKNESVQESSWYSKHGTTITSALSASSVAIGVASASYIHFMWIQCPSKHRVPILAFFVGVNFLGSWLSIFLLSGLKMTPFFILLSCQVFGGIWHLCSSIVFDRKLRRLNDEEKKNIKNMQF